MDNSPTYVKSCKDCASVGSFDSNILLLEIRNVTFSIFRYYFYTNWLKSSKNQFVWDVFLVLLHVFTSILIFRKKKNFIPLFYFDMFDKKDTF